MAAQDPQGPPHPYAGDEAGYRPEPIFGATIQDTADIHRLLVDSVRDYAIIVLDRTGHILTWNKGAEHCKGYTADEVIGRHFSIFYPREVAESGYPQQELQIAATEGVYEDEGWRVRRDGSRFWANVIITALRDETGELIGFAKVTRDLSKRKRLEEALRQSERRFRLLVQSVTDYGIFMLDPEGRVASWNEGAERIKGYRAEEILGKPFSIFYPPEDVAAGKPAYELSVASREGRYEDQGWRVRKDGSLFWANVVITALRNEAGEPIGFAKVTRDLTERRKAELRAIEDAKRVAAAEMGSRAKSEFLAAMSHELRTPLNAISGYTDLLLLGIHGPLTDRQRDALERIRRSQQHLLGLITDLLNFSRIEAGRITYRREPVRLGAIAQSVRPMIEPRAAEKEITLEWPDPADDVVALADGAKVEQILLNLLTNAVKYTNPGGHVRVRYYARDGWAALDVIDNGIGIPAEMTEAIFEPFLQVGRSLTSPHEGVGLGLAISRELARAMGGDITVKSKLRVGSTFTLTLPLADVVGDCG